MDKLIVLVGSSNHHLGGLLETIVVMRRIEDEEEKKHHSTSIYTFCTVSVIYNMEQQTSETRHFRISVRKIRPQFSAEPNVYTDLLGEITTRKSDKI